MFLFVANIFNKCFGVSAFNIIKVNRINVLNQTHYSFFFVNSIYNRWIKVSHVRTSNCSLCSGSVIIWTFAKIILNWYEDISSCLKNIWFLKTLIKTFVHGIKLWLELSSQWIVGVVNWFLLHSILERASATTFVFPSL